MIRRPLLFAAISFLCAVLFYFLAGRAFACFVLALMLPVCVFTVGRVRKIFIIVIIFYSMSIFNCVFHYGIESPLERYADTDRETEIIGKVTGCVRKTSSSGSSYLQLTVAPDIDGGNCVISRILEKNSKLLVNIYSGGTDSKDYIPGYMVKICGKIYVPDGRRNPNCFDYRLYLKSIGITHTMTADKIKILDKKDTLSGKLYLLKELYTKEMEESIGKEAAGLVKGVIFGEKEGISEDVIEEFQRNGTAHILAVSGLHIGMIYGIVSAVWRWRKGKIYFIFVSAFLCCYCILASFSPSVVRAVFMIEMHIASKLMHRRYDMSSAAFLTAMLMVWKNPVQIFNAGFQMSFLAVLTLSVILPFIKSVYGGIFAVSLSVQIGLFPYTMYMFNYISAASVFVNVPIIFFTGIMVPLCLAALPASLVCGPIFEIISKPLYGICCMIQNMNSAVCIEGVTSFDTVSPGRIFMALFYIGVLVFLSEEGRLIIIRQGRKAVFVMILACIVFSVFFGHVTKSGFENASVIFVDVGQGDCMHFRTSDGRNYLIDGGGKKDYNVGKKVLKPYLLKNGVKKIDGVFVTHLHQDHYKGIAELCREGMVDKLFLYEGNREYEKSIVKDTGILKENIFYLKEGDIVKVGNDAAVRVMWPEPAKINDENIRSDDENETSLILKVYVGSMSFMMTGDVDSDCHDRLAERYSSELSSDILKVAHHGSKYSYSEDFTKFLSPCYAVFQVGENIYGHPDEEVLRKYEERGIKVYRNDEDGAVGFDVSDMEKVVTVIQ